MDSDASHAALAEVDSIPLSTWLESRNVPRSTGFRLLKLAGIKAGTMKVATSRKPVAALNQQQIQALDHLAVRLANGATIPQLEAELETALVAAAAPSETVPDDPGPSHQPLDVDTLLARLEAGERAIRSGLPLSTAEVAWLLLARPGGDRAARAGVEAIRHGRNCWRLRRSESVSDLPRPAPEGLSDPVVVGRRSQTV